MSYYTRILLLPVLLGLVYIVVIPDCSLASSYTYAAAVDAKYIIVEQAYILDTSGKVIWVNQGSPVGHIQHLCICEDPDEDGIRSCYWHEGWTSNLEEPYFYASKGCRFADEQGDPRQVHPLKLITLSIASEPVSDHATKSRT